MTTETQTAQQRQIPEGFPGSLPEFLVFEELERRGLQSGVDYIYQSPLQGGRTQRGGVIVDFLFDNPPGLGISVLGVYFHRDTQGADLMQRAQLAGLSITLIFIDEEDIYSDTRFYVGEALNYRDHSRLAGSI